MAEHNDLGRLGEDIAIRHLKAKAYDILEANWRCGRLEVDIIARINDHLVFAEVKTRSGTVLKPPDESVNRRKQQHLIHAANAYIAIVNLDLEVRFDIITVIFGRGSAARVCHIENAFYPAVRS